MTRNPGETMRVAAVQMCSGVTPQANLAALEQAVEAAASEGAHYVQTPEMTVVFAENRDGLKAVAGAKESTEAIAQAGAMAKRHGIYLHIGSLAIALPDGHYANRSVLLSPQGEVVASYDKIHLFDATIAGLKAYRESDTYRAGTQAVVTDAPGFQLGMAICYDMRFPALFNMLANAGAQVLAVPAAFTVPTGQAHWESLLRARAIETGSYVIAAAQGGMHENGRATYGHSIIIDPWGKVIAEAKGDAPQIIYADLDLERVADARARVPALANARPFSIKR